LMAWQMMTSLLIVWKVIPLVVTMNSLVRILHLQPNLQLKDTEDEKLER